jgi:outer membrane protein TolC
MKFRILFLTLSFLEGAELFTPEHISQYLNEKNPFFSTLYNRERVAKEKIEYFESAFDTKITGKYDNKEYPATTGDYHEIFLKKKIESGIELFTGYRNAEGTQEYNNIKTGKDGEAMIGVKLPIFELVNGTNSYKTALEVAKIEHRRDIHGSKNSFRIFYLEVLKSYYTMLYNKMVLDFEKQLLVKAQNRKSFIEKRVSSGLLPQLSLLEAKQQIINREQRFFVATASFKNSLVSFVKYLGITKEKFQYRYFLEDSLKIEFKEFNFDEVLRTAKSNRPDIKMLELEKEKIYLEKIDVNRLKYPNMNLTLYGVHDLKYGNGFKFSFDMEFPFERSKYNSKVGEYLQSLRNIDELVERKTFEITTALRNLMNSLEILRKNIENAEEEVSLVQKLENAENRKYVLGSSSLFILNQREIYTLDIKKKVLQYKLNYLLLREELNSQMGI